MKKYPKTVVKIFIIGIISNKEIVKEDFSC